MKDGIQAYALEHADLEERFALDLERRWDVARRRAKTFMDSGFEFDLDNGPNGDDNPTVDPDHANPPPRPADTVTLNLRELDALDISDDED